MKAILFKAGSVALYAATAHVLAIVMAGLATVSVIADAVRPLQR